MFLKSLNFITMTGITLLILWGLGWVWFASSIAFGKDNDALPKAEAIIVLTGGNGRVNAGLNLLSDKIAPKLFISGVHKGTKKSDIFASWKTPKNPKLCCIELGYEATNTSENALEVQKWVTANNIQKLILVTSRYHMPRAYLEISRSLPSNTQIFQYSTDSSDFQAWKGRFWPLTFSEYNKTLIQWLRLSTNKNASQK
jgi:uncharacterized SAM-binding protein YcdF (DUF218 family)